jgi:hypothetical protein
MTQPDLLSPLTVANLDRARAIRDIERACKTMDTRAYNDATRRLRDATTRVLRLEIAA